MAGDLARTWIAQPGACPAVEHIRRLQDYLRLCNDYIVMAGSHEQHMQKALERMNLKIHDVISDLTGMSGLNMIEAILEERNRQRCWRCVTHRFKRTRRGDCGGLARDLKPEHLFALRQAMNCGTLPEQDPRVRSSPPEGAAEITGPEDPQAPSCRRRRSGAGSTRRRLRVCTACSGGCAGGKIRPRCLGWPTTRC